MQSSEMVRRTIVMILIKWRRKEIGVGREYGCPCEGNPPYIMVNYLAPPLLCAQGSYIPKRFKCLKCALLLNHHSSSLDCIGCIDLNSFSFPNIVLRWWLVKRLFWPKDTIWASGDSLWYPVLDEVGHDDEVDGPVARVEQEEHEGEDVGGGAIEAQLEASQLCLKIHKIQSKTIFGDQVILKHIISVLQLKWMLECVHCPTGW